VTIARTALLLDGGRVLLDLGLDGLGGAGHRLLRVSAEDWLLQAIGTALIISQSAAGQRIVRFSADRHITWVRGLYYHLTWPQRMSGLGTPLGRSGPIVLQIRYDARPLRRSESASRYSDW
jgi:hypothetical protein